MLATDWLRKWRSPGALDKRAESVVRAAARGDSFEQVLDLAAHELLAAGTADRAGLWLAGVRRGEPVLGRVIDSISGPIPREWTNFDISSLFLRAALQGSEPLRAEFTSEESLLHLGPLVGMRGAVWIPLRVRDRALGLAMVGYARSDAASSVNLEPLRTRAEEASLAIAQYVDNRRRELADEERRSSLRLSRAILSGVSVESILPQIVRAARHHAQAEFAAFVGLGDSSHVMEIWDGPDGWRNWLRGESFQDLNRRALVECGEVDLSREAIAALPCSPEPQGRPLDRVVAFPIEVRDRVCGILLAGLPASENTAEDTARLDCYALLAASALDRERSQLELAGAAEGLRRTVEESGECQVLSDGKGRIRESSVAARKLLRMESSPHGNENFLDLFSPASRPTVAEWFERVIHNDHGQGAASFDAPGTLDASLAAGTPVRVHLRSKIEARGNLARQWLLHIEDHGSAEPQLEARLAALMDSIDSGVLVLDARGNIRVVSDRLAQIVGMEARSMVDLGTIEALIESLSPRFSQPVETAARWREHIRKAEEASWDELELVRPSRKIVERFARPLLDSAGARVGWLEVYRDITGQRTIQAKLLQTEKMAALGQLVSGIAHELNNPLTSIQGYAQLLIGRRSAADRISDARRISQEAVRASRIVKNLLLFSRETKPERRAVNLNETIERTVALRSYELKIENIDLDLTLDATLPQTLADAAQLQQVVLNLIVNAEQAIQQGRAQRSLQGDAQDDAQGRIRIRTRRLPGDRIAMEISDDGPGIAPEIVSRIFDPFFTTKPVGVGTGLGLSIVYGIVQEHGGEVSVESQPGRGAALSVELPALSAAAIQFPSEEPAAARSVAVVPVRRHERRQVRLERILVVEDEPTVSDLIADVLTDMGHPVDALLDSREALDRVKKNHYDLVICDLRMPHLGGAGLYRELVSRGSPLQHRLLFVTGDTMSPRTLEFLTSSGLPYLAKPFRVEELKEAVRAALAAAPEVEHALAGAGRPQAVAREK